MPFCQSTSVGMAFVKNDNALEQSVQIPVQEGGVYEWVRTNTLFRLMGDGV